jgi:cell division protein FtsL
MQSRNGERFARRLALLASIVCTAFLVVTGANAVRESWAKDAQVRANREKQCTDLGGVAIFDGWTGELARCDFPPKVQR